MESGQVNLLKRQWMPDAVCHEERDRSLSFSKLVSLFGLLAVGFVISLALFLSEQILGLTKIKHKPNLLDIKSRMSIYGNQKLNVVMEKWSIPNKLEFLRELDEALNVQHNELK